MRRSGVPTHRRRHARSPKGDTRTPRTRRTQRTQGTPNFHVRTGHEKVLQINGLNENGRQIGAHCMKSDVGCPLSGVLEAHAVAGRQPRCINADAAQLLVPHGADMEPAEPVTTASIDRIAEDAVRALERGGEIDPTIVESVVVQMMFVHCPVTIEAEWGFRRQAELGNLAP